MIEARSRQQLSSMFHLRGLFGCPKDLYVLVVLLCATFILISCERCSLSEAERHIEIDNCKPYSGNSHISPLGIFDDDVSSLASKQTAEQRSLEKICPDPNLFCFLSTLSGFSFDGVGTESEELEAYDVQSEAFPSELKQEISNLSWHNEHSIFNTFSGRVISCSTDEPDDFHGSSSSNDNSKNGGKVNVSSCMSTLIDHGSHMPKSKESVDKLNLGILHSLSSPPVEIKPVLLDWGHKHLYHPSVAFLTVKNVYSDSVLTIYYPYSSNSLFYPCNFTEILLAPGEMESICFTFFPRKLGLSSAEIVLQTSFGGFLIQAKGFAVDSPYFIKPIDDFSVSSSGRWRNILSLFNPFSEVLYVEEITAWISTSSGNISHLSKAICSAHSMDKSSEEGMSAKEWLNVVCTEGRLPEISIRPHKNWEVPPQRTETIMELEISDQFEGKFVGAFCLQLVRSSADEIETVVVPLEAELRINSAFDTDYISVSLEALVLSDSSSPAVALSVRNDGPLVLSVNNVREVGDCTENFQIKFVEGLVLFPRSVTQVAIISYLEGLEVDMNCNLLLWINDTRSSQIEISCKDVISVFAGHRLDSTTKYAQEIYNANHIEGRKSSFYESGHPPTDFEAVDKRQADELVLNNWKSQARASFMSVLEEEEVLFPMVEVGNHFSEWIAVQNPSNQPILVQLILNSGEVIDNCRTSEMHLQPSSSIIVGNKSIAPTKYGFSIAKDGLTDALIHPYGSASLGPILFQPSVRCQWRSSALIRNNLSGLEWLSLRGFGGSISLVLLEGSDSVQSLEFKMNFPLQLNFSSPETLHSTEGKKPLCSHPLIKEVYVKNTGDFPLEVLRIEVSGSGCDLDGFQVLNCKGFTLPPSESKMLQISYQSDFSTATVQRDLELSLASGILVIPMRASLPMLLLNICKRSTFWMRLKKIMLLVLFAASVLFFVVHLLFPISTAFASEDLKSGKTSSAASGTFNYLSMRLKKRTNALMLPEINGLGRSIVGEAFVLGSAGGKGKADDSEHHKHKNSSIDELPETRITSSDLNFSPVENSDIQAESDSQSLSVKISNEKRRRRRKKKSSGMRVPGIFDVSSSQSSNSTPTSPLSPATSLTPKRSWLVPLDMDQPVEVRNPFSEASDVKRDKIEYSEPPKINLLKSDVVPKHDLARKVAGRAVLLPSATFPSAGRPTPPWTCHTPFVASTSTISPQARAPGKKLHNPKTSVTGEVMAVEEKFTYDIWGDHIFRLPVVNQLNHSSSVPFQPLENNSESFFVRDPQTLMTNSLLTPRLSGLEADITQASWRFGPPH